MPGGGERVFAVREGLSTRVACAFLPASVFLTTRGLGEGWDGALGLATSGGDVRGEGATVLVTAAGEGSDAGSALGISAGSG